MKFLKISSGVCAGLLTSTVVLAFGDNKNKPETSNKPVTAETKQSDKAPSPPKRSGKKSKKVEMVYFDGCGRKDKKGQWAEFYANCETEENGVEIPAPPCKAGWVTVKDVVPENMISHLQQCVVEL